MDKKNKKVIDLTSYLTIRAESIGAKVELLTQIIADKHYGSIGAYQERLLARAISEVIPKDYSVGTGFVLFPCEQNFEDNAPLGYDKFNMSGYVLSKQCDIIVYESATIPTVFQDEDFVIVRPESVKAIIEVKGNLRKEKFNKYLNSIHDFTDKWNRCRLFYQVTRSSEEPLETPLISIFAWNTPRKTEDNIPEFTGQQMRKQVVKFYKNNYPLEKVTSIRPVVLDTIYIYNEYIIEHGGAAGYVEEVLAEGWHTSHGKFLRKNDDGSYFRQGDRTIATLLANIQYSVGRFNRFFSYVDEIRHFDESTNKEILDHEDAGFDLWVMNNSN